VSLRSEMQTLLRRSVAKVIGEYPAPALAHAQELLQDLEAAAGGSTADGEWSVFAAQISRALREHGADRFLRLGPIAQTLHPRIRSPGSRYVRYVFRSGKLSSRLHTALTESPIGQPLLNPYYALSSPLLIQHGYHLLRLLEATDFDLARARLIVEFGGGYGSFFRLLRNMDYRERYIICDLPVMCALQRFYLRNMFPTDPGGLPPENLTWLCGTFREALERETAGQRPSLFVATWSLSETPLHVRDQIAPALGGFSYILCAYQREFAGCDNVHYFRALEQQLPQFAWQHAECPVYKNNFYLIGANRLQPGRA